MKRSSPPPAHRPAKKAAGAVTQPASPPSAAHADESTPQPLLDRIAVPEARHTWLSVPAGASGALERARNLWLVGRWDALADISADEIARDPQRATLAAFCSAGHQHVGDSDRARSLMRQAMAWGCSPDLAARLLIAGIHRSLGRARALEGRMDNARSHLEAGLGVGLRASEHELLALAGNLHDDRFGGQASDRSHADDGHGVEPAPALEGQAPGLPASARAIQIDCSSDDDAEIWRQAEQGELTLSGRAVSVKSYSLGDTVFRIAMRTASKGDIGTANQILVSKDYDFEWLPHGKSVRALYNQHVAVGRAPLIVDAGANIGISALYFLHRYPAAHVYAVEPDEDNGRLLRLNCRSRDVTLLPGALAAGVGELFLVDPGDGDWAFRAEEIGDQPLLTVGVAEILAEHSPEIHPPLVVKIDIEGGEKRVFEHGAAWLDKVPLLIVELHDWMLPGERTSAGFRHAVAERDFEIIPRGENLLCFNRHLLMF